MNNYHERSYSNQTAEKIDQEVKMLIEQAHKRALEILESKKEHVQLMADMLMEFETLDSTDIKEIMDGTWSPEKKKGRLKTADELQKLPTSDLLPAQPIITPLPSSRSTP
jgi:cell division protease FtsH